MSRDYDGWCPECNKDHAIVGFIADEEYGVSLSVVWCKETGKFWYKETILTPVMHEGKNESDWRNVENKAYLHFEKMKKEHETCNEKIRRK